MMIPSQLLLTVVILFIIARTLVAYKKNNFSRSFTVVWIFFWLGVIFFIFQQNIVIQVAHKLGISRGVDLIIYLSLIAVFYFIYRLLGTLYEIDAKITKIVREVAIKDVKKKKA